MIGREAYQNPYFLAAIEQNVFKHTAPNRIDIALAMIPYIEQQSRDFGTPLKSVTRHMLNLFAGQRGGRIWRRVLSTEAFKEDVNPSQLIHSALEHMQEGHNLADAA